MFIYLFIYLFVCLVRKLFFERLQLVQFCTDFFFIFHRNQPLGVPHMARAFGDDSSIFDDVMTKKRQFYIFNKSMHVTRYAKLPARAHLGLHSYFIINFQIW